MDLPNGMVEYQNPLGANMFLEKFFNFLVISGLYGLFVDEQLLLADVSHKLETSGLKRDCVLFPTHIMDDRVDRFCYDIALWKPIGRRTVSEVVRRLPILCGGKVVKTGVNVVRCEDCNGGHVD